MNEKTRAMRKIFVAQLVLLLSIIGVCSAAGAYRHSSNSGGTTDDAQKQIEKVGVARLNAKLRRAPFFASFCDKNKTAECARIEPNFIGAIRGESCDGYAVAARARRARGGLEK